MKKRIISAVFLLLIFIPLIIIGKVPFTIFVCVLGLLGLKELLNLEKDIPLFLKYSAFFFTMFMILYNYNDNSIIYLLNYKFLIVLTLYFFLAVVIIGDVKKYNYKDALFLIMSITFLGFAFNGLIIVRNIGVEQIFYIALIATLTDTFAYFTGMLVGKHKLTPISPHKTIEGSIGGSLIGSVITSLLYMWYTNSWSSWLVILLVTFVLSIVGQCGDLFFSSIKRTYKIKDFSNLIPGHGGILDRLDSIIFVLLCYMLILL